MYMYVLFSLSHMHAQHWHSYTFANHARAHTHIYVCTYVCVYIYLFIYSHTNGLKVQLVMKWLWCKFHNILSHMHHLYMAKSLRFWMKGKVISIISLLIFTKELKMNSRFGNWEVPSKYCSIRYKIIWA